MGPIARYAFLVVAAGIAGTAAADQVTVSFPNSDRYTDMDLEQLAPAATLSAFAAHLQKLGRRYLPPDRTLKIEVLDIDLAGSDEWWHRSPYRMRVLRSVSWPHITLRYTLAQGETELLRGEESISDLNYLGHVSRYFGDDPLRYEKQMLDGWFRTRFAAIPVQ
jgi:hypothetical protein